jgi:Arc/MetJ-type ribon-helix-helix transcriptional regulator
MQVRLDNPRLERFVTEQVEAGNYPSADAAIEAAVERMMLDNQDAALTDEDLDAINQADAEIDRGQFVDFDAFADQMRKKYGAGGH